MSQRPTTKTMKFLFAASGGICAFPGCGTKLVDAESEALLGEVCHIHASLPGGPRYVPQQSDEERHKEENLIILCPTHHSLVDQDPYKFSGPFLKDIKLQHQNKIAAMLEIPSPELPDQQATEFSRQVADEAVDFAIVVARSNELEALKHQFPELSLVPPEEGRSELYYRGVVHTNRNGSYRIVVTMLHQLGNVEAAHSTANVIRDWKPRYLIVNGVAGGLSENDQSFGDIVVSRSILYYEQNSRSASQFDVECRRFEADRSLLSGVFQIANDRWAPTLPDRPDQIESSEVSLQIHIGPIASGEKIIASNDGVQTLKKLDRKLIAVEMESAGVASAAFSAVKDVGFITIRSICDFADGGKNDNWQNYATHAAAAFVRTFLDSGPVAFSEGSWPVSSRSTIQNRETKPAATRQLLFDRLCTAYDVEEFKNLCFLLGVDFDELPGDRKSARVRELILMFERKDQIDILRLACEDET